MLKFCSGDFVKHSKFGLGRVVCNGVPTHLLDFVNTVLILFDSGELKLFYRTDGTGISVFEKDREGYFFDGEYSDEVVEFHNTLDLNTRRW